MKNEVTRFKSMKIALKEIEHFVKKPEKLQAGKPLEKFGGMRPRELLANWLICAAVNAIDENRKLQFTSDPTGGDGIIRDEKSGQPWFTEHVIASKFNATDGSDAEKLILNAIDKKLKKGKEYAIGKILIVLLYGDTNMFFPNRITRKLPSPLHFDQVYLITLQTVKGGVYEYGVALLDISSGNAPTYLVRINSDFTSWEVKKLQ